MSKSAMRYIVLVGIIAILSVVTGCSASYVGNREQAFNMIQQGFSSLESTPGLHQEVQLRNVKVVIVGDREQFEWKKAAAANSHVAGYATPDNEIWIFGKVVNGQVVVNEAIIGHELMHLLNFSTQSVANPDQLTAVFNN